MLGSHDTLTYLESKSWVCNCLSRLWRTQGYTIREQYALGIRMFDIRLRQSGNGWVPCHGIVDLRFKFRNIFEICALMRNSFPEAIYRIVLERGAENEFKRQTVGSNLCKRFPNLWRVDIKRYDDWMGAVDNNNQSLYDRGYKFALANTWEEPNVECHGTVTAKNFWKVDLRTEAKRINDGLDIFKDSCSLVDAMLSKERLYLLDYCAEAYYIWSV